MTQSHSKAMMEEDAFLREVPGCEREKNKRVIVCLQCQAISRPEIEEDIAVSSSNSVTKLY